MAWVPDRGDVILIDFNPQAGREMRDRHPMLVLSPREFNDRTSIVIGLPITHAASNDSNPFAVKFKAPKGDIGYVLSHQPKSFDWRVRGARQHALKRAPDSILQSACDKLNAIVQLASD
jgi:mRNA interferase MazF